MLASYSNPRKSQSLVDCTEKKLEIWVQGVRWVSLEKGSFAFFSCSIVTSSPGQWAEIVAQSLGVF